MISRFGCRQHMVAVSDWFDHFILLVCDSEIHRCLKVCEEVEDKAPMDWVRVSRILHQDHHREGNVWSSAIGDMVESSARLAIWFVEHIKLVFFGNWELL